MTLVYKMTMKLNKVYVIYLKPHSKEEEETLALVYKVLNKSKISYVAFERKLFNETISKDVDLIIVVGGDGTFLRTSHYIDKALMLGVNSNSKTKEGFFMQCNKQNFEEKFNNLLKGNFKTLNLLRLEAKINGATLYPALNDLFIGHQLPYKISKFEFSLNKDNEPNNKYGNKHNNTKNVINEFQKCSGLILSTPAGSSGWAVSAGGKKLNLSSETWEYVIREQYEGKLHKHRLNNGELSKKDMIKVKILEPAHILSIDSINDFKLKQGDVVTVKVSDKTLKYIQIK